jgi:hypothetical protein
MKFISVILITIIVFSSVVPCMDEETVSFSEEIVLSAPAEQTHSESEDNCSPFCNCTCCSISFSMVFSMSSDSYIRPINSIIHLHDNYIFNPLLKIWQPPKA